MKAKTLNKSAPSWEKGRLTEEELMGIEKKDYGLFNMMALVIFFGMLGGIAFVTCLCWCIKILRDLQAGM